jgi:hypothetical protein
MLWLHQEQRHQPRSNSSALKMTDQLQGRHRCIKYDNASLEMMDPSRGHRGRIKKDNAVSSTTVPLREHRRLENNNADFKTTTPVSIVMYVPGRHGGAERREQRGQRERKGQRERRQMGVGFSLCAAPSCPCALYFRVRVGAERRLGQS